MGETYIVKQHQKTNFTILDNTCIKDVSLSWKAKGLHSYIMSLPDDWKIYVRELLKHASDGKASLYSAITELELHGYLRREKKRRENGRFETTVYYISEIPHTDFRDVDNPDTENRTQLNTNLTNNLNKQNTELTSVEVSAVSESEFHTIIRNLFDGDYSFDKNFENDVKLNLEKAGIANDFLESFLNYVFERTQDAKPTKSFEGFYRSLALSKSVARDFRLSRQSTIQSETTNGIVFIQCPVCGSSFNEYDFYCPVCTLTVTAIKNHDKQEIQIHSKLFHMSETEKEQYENSYREFTQKIKKETGRSFLRPKENLQFYKQYGLIN